MTTQRYVEINDGIQSVWMIERIWQLAETLPTEEIPIADICGPDEVTWFGDSGPGPTCRAIAEHCRRINNADLSYPVILTEDYRVFDGMHRIAKCIMQGKTTIAVKRFRKNPAPDQVRDLNQPSE
ncbi:chromosome partitioning protein ParB [Vibrio navarrensis]|uniref:chromosome partitioning protein ParB n=1 Tax=Vibrio navarrensis TaxID=29495 RepID=UPI00186A23EF|nr:chromosome partitioning protein ParB [Vibrio navarrensis]MBE4618247.1 chromosome partitioning protein ParB [Vibrio navarrensis]